MKLQNLSPLKKSIFFLLFTILFVRFLGITSFSDLVFPKINRLISKVLYSISNWISFSIGDLFYTILTVFILFFIIRLILLIRKKEFILLKIQFSKGIYFLAAFYFIFHIVWGFNYYKTSLVEHFGTEEIKVEELKELAEMYWERSVVLRNQVQEDENGVFKMSLTQGEIRLIISETANDLNKKYPELLIRNNNSPNLKPSFYSTLFSYLGVSGYYIPFTTEAQYNENLPATKLLFTQLHETAHQWSFAPENEANFVGFLLGVESSNLELQYVANFRAMRSILNRLLWIEPQYVKDFLEKYSPGMQRDREYELKILRKYNHKAEDAFSLMNEAFLRINNQEGLESYGRFVELLVGYNRKYLN